MEARRAPEALRVARLTVRYRERVALHDVTFQLAPGEVVALVGPNGAGKSTLLKAVMGLLRHDGHVRLHGRRCHHHTQCVRAAYLPQRADLDLDFPIVVHEVVTSGRRRFLRCGQRLRARDRTRIDEALELVGAADLRNRPIATLSGGELQRVLLARALAQEADVLLLDEAFSGVDQPRVHELLGLLSSLARDGAAVLTATHDLALVRQRFERCLALNRQLIADGRPEDCLQGSQLETLFGVVAPPAEAA